MQRSLEAIFPIKDAASAALIAIKADCLRKAGVISDQEKQWVDSRVRTFLYDAVLPDAAWSGLGASGRLEPSTSRLPEASAGVARVNEHIV
jgi:hypothetical protein